MRTKSEPAKKKSSVCPCPQGCGFSLHNKDKACPICLGIVHTRRVLTEPEACAFCHQLWVPLLSESRDRASSESDDEEFWVEVPAGNWADHMQFATHHEDDDMLDIGLEMHGLSEDEQEALSSGRHCVSWPGRYIPMVWAAPRHSRPSTAGVASQLDKIY